MKKIIISILICMLTIILCACGIKTVTYQNEQEQILNNQFTIIKTVRDNVIFQTCYYIYDNETKIIYLYTIGVKRATMCPYYILVNNEPTIAVYGKNYTLGE